MIRFSHGAATSVGRVRLVNEDNYLAVPPLFVVADGMGGHGAGDVASRIAIEEMTACVALRPLFAEAVLTALEHANRHIIERDEANRMGTTVTGLAGLETVGGDHLMVFNVGDSRVYRLSASAAEHRQAELPRLEQVTVDHSEVQELVLAGVITKEQARTHPRRNIITRALGSDPIVLADHWLLPAVSGDRYLVCSDGLFGELTDEVIRPLLAAGGPQQAAEALVAAAYQAGGRDNVTAVVVDIDADDAGADETTLPRELVSVPREAAAANVPAPPHVPAAYVSTEDAPPENVGLRGLGLLGPDPDLPDFDDNGPAYDSRRPGDENYGPAYDSRRPGDENYGSAYDSRRPEHDNYGSADSYGPGYDNNGPGQGGHGPRFAEYRQGFDEREMGGYA